MKDIDPKVEEAIDTLNMKDGPTRRRLLTGTGLVSATAAASAFLAACTSNSSGHAASGAVGNFPTTPKWKFTFVNHVTDNAFFGPTKSGAADACALLGIPNIQWTGALSSQQTIPSMLSALNSAVSAKVDGIATTVTSATAFTDAVASALSAGIPVVTYNSDGARGNPGTARLAYIGQDLYTSGLQVGTKLGANLSSGAHVVGFIAQPGSLNIQPRIDGATAALQAKGVTVTSVDSGTQLSQESTTIPAYIQAHSSTLQGAFAVDGGSTSLLGPALARFGLTSKVASGGFDLEPATLQAVQAGQLGFTIDQQPYLQGFLPVIYLYMYNLSGGLVAPTDTDTGLRFVNKSNVGPYLNTKTSYEGSAAKPTLVPRSGAITTS